MSLRERATYRATQPGGSRVSAMLLKLVIKNLVQRPLRYALTSVAIIFSVAAVCGVFIFTDGLRVTFGELAENIESGYDIAVQPTTPFGDGGLLTIATDHVERIEPIDGILAVQPRIREVPVIPTDGSGEQTFAPAGPNLGVLWGNRSPNVRLFLQEGAQPVGPEQFALDIDSFAEGDYEIGERYSISFSTDVGIDRTFELTGTFTFANPDRNAVVGARIVAFDEPTALEVLTGGRGYSDITVVLEESADQDAVMAAISEVVDEDVRVRSQAEVLAEVQGQFGEFVDIFQTVLLVFAVIILVVSGILIINVFLITLGQRIRELGLLRAVGALGNQVTTLMLGEALMLGLFGTVVGIPAGLGLAYLLRGALILLGFPDSTGLPVNALTIVLAAMIGIGTTLGAALWPSIQARRVSPLAAMRDGAELIDVVQKRRTIAGLAITLIAIVSGGLSEGLDGWIPALFLPILAGVLFWVGLRFLIGGRASFVVLPIGIAILIRVQFSDFELGETYGLLAAGTVVTLIGMVLINPLIARPITAIAGRGPTMVVVGLMGVLFGLTGAGAVVGAIVLFATGVPDAIIDATGQDFAPAMLAIPLIIAAVVLLITSYGVVRTAWGARGLAGQVSRANAGRNPNRTAITAATLMIGLTLVTAVTIIGDSIKTSVSNALDSSITADWILQGPQSGPGGTPFSAEAGRRLAAIDEVESVVPIRVAFPAAWATSESGELRADDFIEFLPIVLQLLDDQANLSIEELLELQEQLGTDIELNDAVAADFATLDDHVDPDFITQDLELAALPNAIYIVDEFAEEKGLAVGDTFSALFVDLQSEDLVVAGIYSNGFVLGSRVVTLELWERHFPDQSDNLLTVVTASGVPAETARAAIEAELADDFPIVDVQDREEFAAAAELQINQVLATVNVLLGLSGIIAILGILIALALSVFERTREIGLMRAVGTSRAQTRWIIRWEGVMIAIFGGVTGIVIGIAVGVLAAAKLPEIIANAVSVPIPTLVAYLVFAALTGLAAAVFPAWVAGRMNVLESISTE